MTKISKNSKINNFVKSILKTQSGWRVRHGKKHNILIAPDKRIFPIPNTPSDYRAFQNFYHDVRRQFSNQ